MPNGPADATATVIQDLKTWAKQPYVSNMNLGGWALFVGAVIALSAGWAVILHDLRGDF